LEERGVLDFQKSRLIEEKKNKTGKGKGGGAKWDTGLKGMEGTENARFKDIFEFN